MKNPIMEFFDYKHLPEALQEASRPFFELANDIEENHVNSAEKSTALRKLLEAKDAAVRSKMLSRRTEMIEKNS